MGALHGKIALVAGGTRGAGRGIAVELGAAGATVWVTGRSSGGMRSDMDRPETIEETAHLVEQAGGKAVAMKVDHMRADEVAPLIERIRQEHGGLDVLVNDVWGGDPLAQWGKTFWEHDLGKGLLLIRRALETHLVTSWHALPLLIERKSGLVIEVTDGVARRYRGSLFYDLAKSAVIRFAQAQAEELRPHGVAALALTPGFLRSEAMLDHFGVTASTWREAIAQDEHFAFSETPRYIGRAVAALASDPRIFTKTGGAFSTWQLMREYGFTDVDGTQPDWGQHARDAFGWDLSTGEPPLG